MSEQLLLTVIVPVYNAESYLRKCVDSILHQTYKHLEVFLVDDGSTDASPEICDAYRESDQRVRVIHKVNGGQAIARNAALDVCRGDYVTFVDSDDFLIPDAYEKMMALAAETGAGVVCCGRYNVDEETGEKTLGLCPQRQEVISAEEMLGRMFTWQNCDCSPCDKIFKRTVFECLRFPPQSGFEDIGILYKLVLAGKETALLPEPCYCYLQRTGSTSYGAVSKRIFQYPMYTEMVWEDICRDYPNLRNEVRFLRIRSLSWPLILLDQADRLTRLTFEEEMKSCRKELRKYVGSIITNSYLGNQERITDLLLAFNSYRCLRRLIHRDSEAFGA